MIKNVVENKCSILNHKRRLVLAVDFDGTIVEDKWPDIGPLKPNCKEILITLHDIYNCDVVIWTCRDTINNELQPVVKFLTEQGIKFESVNKNTPYIMSLFKNDNPDCRKVFADLYIDDKSLHFANNSRGVVWTEVLFNVLKFKEQHNNLFE